MSGIPIFKMKARQLSRNLMSEMAQYLRVKAKAMASDEGIAFSDGKRSLAYGQPCARMAGVLLFTDQNRGMAEPIKRVVPVASAKRWTDGFLKKFKLYPSPLKEEKVILDFSTEAVHTDAILFDGKERRKQRVKTDVSSRILINDIPVTGPRAKVRMVFKDVERPIFIYCALWADLEIFEERELVSQHDVFLTVKEKLADRQCRTPRYTVGDVRLAYFAPKFKGGPDLLEPYYFVEIEYADPKNQKGVEIQGPRQVFWIPASK